MKERPILFNGDMVRAILDGRKTQTRRPVKHHNISVHLQSGGNLAMSWCDFPGEPHTVTFDDIGYACPYGVVGDRLWVRETWRATQTSGYIARNFDETSDIWYKVDNDLPSWANWGKWRPSIHMPRWANVAFNFKAKKPGFDEVA